MSALHQNKENSKNWNKGPHSKKSLMFLAKIAFAGTLLLGPIDLATSDVVGAKIVQLVDHDVHPSTDSTLDHLIQDGVVGGFIFGQSMALGEAVARSKRVDNSMEDYAEVRKGLIEKAEKNKFKRAIKAPLKPVFAAGSWLGGKLEKTVNRGEQMQESDNAITKRLGHLVTDTAKVNYMGTTNVSLIETAQGDPPSHRRLIWLGGLITASWLGMAEGVKEASHAINLIPDGHYVTHGIADVWNTITPNLAQPLSIGTIGLGVAAVWLARRGMQVAEYQNQQAMLETPNIPIENVN